MYRILALSVVLTLAAGHNAAWVCGTWCGPLTGTTACEHQPSAASTRLSSATHCPTIAVVVTAASEAQMPRPGTASGTLAAAARLATPSPGFGIALPPRRGTTLIPPSLSPTPLRV